MGKATVAIASALAAALALMGCGAPSKAEQAVALYETRLAEVEGVLAAGERSKAAGLAQAAPAAMMKDYPELKAADFTEDQLARIKKVADRLMQVARLPTVSTGPEPAPGTTAPAAAAPAASASPDGSPSP